MTAEIEPRRLPDSSIDRRGLDVLSSGEAEAMGLCRQLVEYAR